MYDILLPWQHFRFEPSLIRNIIISFSTSQWGHNGFRLLLVCIGTTRTTFDRNSLNCLPVRKLKEYFKNNKKRGLEPNMFPRQQKFMFSSSSHVES